MSHLSRETKSSLYVSDSFVFLKLNNNFLYALFAYITVPVKTPMSQEGERWGGGVLSSSFVIRRSVTARQMSAEHLKHALF